MYRTEKIKTTTPPQKKKQKKQHQTPPPPKKKQTKKTTNKTTTTTTKTTTDICIRITSKLSSLMSSLDETHRGVKTVVNALQVWGSKSCR